MTESAVAGPQGTESEGKAQDQGPSTTGGPSTPTAEVRSPASKGATVFGILLVILFAAVTNGAVIWAETRPPAITGGDPGGGPGGAVVLPIGVVLPQSGLLGSEGVKMVQGAKLAEKDINDAGGIKLAGNVTARVEIHVEDDRTDVGFGKQAAQYLVSVKHVEAIVGSAASSVTLSVGEVTAPEEVFLISPASTSPLLSGKPWIFRTVGSDEMQGQAMLDLVVALKDAGKVSDKVYIFSILNAYGAGLTEVMKKHAASRGLVVIGDQLYEEQKENFDAEMQAIRKARDERAPGEKISVMFTSYPEAAVRVLTTALKLGVTLNDGFQWVSNDGIAHSDEIANDASSREAAQGLYGTNPATPPSDPAYRAFFSRYQAANQNESPASYSATAYDGVMVIAEATRRAGKYDGGAIRAEVAKMTGNASYRGVSGGKDFDPNGDLRYQWYEVYKVVGSDFVSTGAWWDDPAKGVENFTAAKNGGAPGASGEPGVGLAPAPAIDDATPVAAGCSPSPCLEILAPRAGDALKGAWMHDLTWVSNGTTNGTGDSWVSYDGGSNWVHLWSNLPANGTMRWGTPPIDVKDARIRMTMGGSNGTMTVSTGDFYVDSTPPKSSVLPLPPVLNVSYTDQYPIAFSVDEGPAGSGLALATLSVKVERRGDNFTTYDSSNRSPIQFTPGKEGKHFFYTVAVDRAGNVEADKWQDLDGEAQSWIDVAPPSVSGSTPFSGAQDVDFAPTFEVVFSEIMQPETVRISSTRGSPPVPGPDATGVTWSYFKERLYFVLDEPLRMDETYEVAVAGGKDLIDKTMDAYYLRFRTRAEPLNASSASGRVIDVVSRQAIAGAEVRALYDGTNIEVASAVSAADGAFGLSGLAPTWIEFRAKAPGYSDAVVVTQLQQRESRTLNLSLAPQGLAVGVVRGKVIDESGEPVGGAAVSSGLAAAMTAADGSFEVAVPAGGAEVEVTKEGFTPVRKAVEVAAGGEKVENFRILRTRGVTLAGAVAILLTDLIAAAIVFVLLRRLKRSSRPGVARVDAGPVTAGASGPRSGVGRDDGTEKTRTPQPGSGGSRSQPDPDPPAPPP